MDHNTIIRRQWPGYEVLGFLGGVGSRRIYKIANKSSTGEARYAVKVIPVSEIEKKRKQNPEECMKELSQEVRVMQILKGHPHIVSIEDFAVICERESNQSYLLIRMELLKSFGLWRDQRGELTREDIVRLGIELCRALEHCHGNKIIHYDIKLDNIFVDAGNHFKLGDFGMSWMAESDQRCIFRVGLTSSRIPEIYNGGFDYRIFESLVKTDIYSMGMVLYKLLNADTDPFLPTDRPATREERVIAEKVRVGGILPVPPPMHADGALSKIILKAIAHDPEQRYASARALREALEALSGTPRTEPHDRNKEQTT